jgi:hypothetical protein
LLEQDQLDGKPTPRKISLLKVNGESLLGVPDYVYHNAANGQIVIVEVKVSNPTAWPADGWPNLRAQLWAYGQIDAYLNLASDIALVGEVWSEQYDPKTMSWSYVPRIRYRWQMSDSVFCAQNEELFEIYKAWASTAREANASGPENAA